MDRQSIYNRIRTHLLAQMEKCTGKHGMNCAYRNAKGLRCAIGAIVPDTLIDRVEKIPYSLGGLLDQLPELKTIWGVRGSEDIVFLRRLQLIHDEYNPGMWETKLDEFAQERGLVVNV